MTLCYRANVITYELYVEILNAQGRHAECVHGFILELVAVLESCATDRDIVLRENQILRKFTVWSKVSTFLPVSSTNSATPGMIRMFARILNRMNWALVS